jgi:acetyl-CoA acyltransferase
MGATAENIAARYSVTREEQDRFAAESQRRAGVGQSEGKLDDEVFAVTATYRDDDGTSKTVTLSRETINRPETTYEGLAKLRPAFRATGTVTAGNASPLTDGAAAAVLMSEELATATGVTPLGYYRDFVVAGVPPEIMGIGPVPAIRKLLAKNGLTVADIDVFEINEAFASVVLGWARATGADLERTNPNGGAIALGHPLGCTGGFLVTKALNELERTGGKYGLISMCCGGGLGTGTIIERL